MPVGPRRLGGPGHATAREARQAMTPPGKILSRLRTRVWLLLALIAIPTFIHALLIFEAQAQRAIAREKESLRQIIYTALEEEKRQIIHSRELLRIMAHSDNLERLSPQNCSQLASRLLKTQKDYLNFGGVRPTGELFCSGVEPLARDINYGDRHWFQEALLGQDTTRGHYIISRTTGKPGIVFSLAMTQTDGSPKAVLFATTSTEWLTRMTFGSKLPRGWDASVVSRDLELIAQYPERSLAPGRKLGDTRLAPLLAASTQENIHEFTDAQGKDWIYGIAPLLSTSSQLYLVIGAPRELILAQVQQDLHSSVLILVILTLLTLGIAHLLIDRSFLSWARQLENAARRLGGGERKLRVHSSTPIVELAHIDQAFNTMAEQLDSKEAQLRKLNRLYRMLTNCDQTIVRGLPEQEMLQRLCEITVNDGGFRMAWVGILQGDQLVPQAWAGQLGNYLHGFDQHPDATTVTALRESRYGCCNDIAGDPAMAPWQEAALAQGYRSTICLPLFHRGAVLGVFGLYAQESNFFDQEEITLLEELAGDMGFAHEVSEAGRRHQLTARSLKESEALFHTLASVSPVGIFRTDPEGNMTYTNEQWCRMAGMEAERALGMGWIEAIHPADREAVQAAQQKAIREQQPFRQEFRLKRPDGVITWVMVQAQAEHDEDGHLLGYVGAATDFTENKRISEELEHYQVHLEALVGERTRQIEILNQELQRRARDADAANRAKSAFLANMSHEIRTPMNAIVGLTHLLQREISDGEQRQKLGHISAAASHLLDIINDILDISKIEAGKLVIQKSDFDLPELIRHTCTLIAGRLQEKGLRLEQQLPPLPQRLHGDPTRLSQVLLNYLSNAVKFTEQGQITLSLKIQEQDDKGLLLRFEVSDTGIGIAPADLARLFTPFEQVDSSTSRRYGGTGLGLTINQRLARLMGGDAGASSTLGQGSTFWFTARLELAHGDAPLELHLETDAAEQLLREQYQGSQILLVEDNTINQDVALALLQGAGLQVQVADNGAVALEKVRQQHYDLILMDVHMPVMDGLEATRAIRALPGYEKTPILAMTASAFSDDRERCIQAGMNAHVAKPVEPESLFATLAHWLSRPQEQPAATSRPSTPTPRQNSFAHIPGLDSQAALARLNGQVELYGKLLDKFRTEHQDDVQTLQQCLAQGDRQQAHQIAHRLKGTAALLGMETLVSQSQRMETLLRDPTPQPSLEWDQSLQLDHALAAMCQALPQASSGSEMPRNTDRSQAQGKLQDLERLLAEDNAMATSFLRQSQDELRLLLGEERLARLRRLVEDYAYPEALELLQEVTASKA